MSFCNVGRVQTVLPPLNPLRVFNVAARLGSFTRAAAELNVSQSAVSRQIAVLEGHLGIQLFRRDRDGVVLTEVGASYHRNTASAFGMIEAATNLLAEDKAAKPLRLRVYTTFAAKWLIGRLGKLQEEHPNIQVQLSHSVKPVDFMRDPIDLAIQLGKGDWPDVNSELLMPDQIQPVCSPKLLKSHPIREIDDLRLHRLLHTRYRRNDWADWLRGVGRLDLLGDQQTVFDSSVLTYQAAIEGVGVAIGQINLLKPDFASGALVSLFDRSIERGLGYYAVWPRHRTTGKNLSVFLRWLRREASLG